MLITSLLSLALASQMAFAADPADAVQRCCRDAGLSGCAPRVRVFADGSGATPEAGGWRALGLWHLTCGQPGRFVPGSTALFTDQPTVGRIVIEPGPPTARACFDTNCPLPPGTCTRPDASGRSHLVTCATGRPVNSAALRSPPVPRVTQAPGPKAQPTAAAVPTGPTNFVGPRPPTQACTTSAALARESRARVMSGDDARVKGQLHSAIAQYRAALVMDPCNPHAWGGFGQAAAAGDATADAIRALETALRFSPEHPGYLCALGDLYAKIDRPDRARELYERALTGTPGHSAATRGLRALSAPR